MEGPAMLPTPIADVMYPMALACPAASHDSAMIVLTALQNGDVHWRIAISAGFRRNKLSEECTWFLGTQIGQMLAWVQRRMQKHVRIHEVSYVLQAL